MKSSDFRAVAREHLKGKWGKVALMTLILFAIACVLSLINNQFNKGIMGIITSIAMVVIEIPLAFGFSFALYKIYKGEEVKYFDFLSLGFGNFKKAWGIALHIILKMLLPIICLIIVYIIMTAVLLTMGVGVLTSITSSSVDALVYSTGAIGIFVSIAYFAILIWLVVRFYLYVMANFIAFDNMEIPAKEAVLESKKIMYGNRGKLFVLILTFLGWAILGALTLGIGYLWIVPYMQFATFAFYQKIKGNDGVKEVKEAENA